MTTMISSLITTVTENPLFFLFAVVGFLLAHHIVRHIVLSVPRLITGFVAPWIFTYIKDLALKFLMHLL